MGAQDGKLYVQRRVEHHVCILLERQDPFLLSIADVLPMADGLLCCESTFIIIADDATQQTVITRRNPIMVVERDACQSGDKDLELHSIWNMLCENGIQRVNTFYDEHAVIL